MSYQNRTVWIMEQARIDQKRPQKSAIVVGSNPEQSNSEVSQASAENPEVLVGQANKQVETSNSFHNSSTQTSILQVDLLDQTVIAENEYRQIQSFKDEPIHLVSFNTLIQKAVAKHKIANQSSCSLIVDTQSKI
ncbi:unnamed protein product [Acanthoscelides obtectus]|uniref:Uncharacterized protein n=1 Tax=Acanthoscelides obtectus TaxID=200917 RepID=A0A9P0LFN0_ACAOB|nr:unnamed protein product [Acanthoscelides obtectus]CAK1626124.1 hypothetical protein AOBTE_LOCUS3628 [Acanthoscelides obtectus]